MLNAALIVKSVLVIGGLVSVPLVTKTLIEASTENYVVNDSGSLIGPIFDCYKNNSNYKVYLVPNVDKLSRNVDLDNNISLRIVEKEGDKPEQIVWETDGSSNKWIQWDIHFLTKDQVKLLNGALGAGGFDNAPTCSNRKIDLKKDKNNGTFWTVLEKETNKKTNFKVDWGTCRKKEECDIVFGEGGLFQWNAGFQPKIKIPLEKR